MLKRKLSFKNVMQGFVFAGRGLKVFYEEERNSRIYIFFVVLVLVLGFFFPLSTTEWIFLFLSISIVVSLELLNSAIERLADRISHDEDLLIKKAKDMAAGSVLVAAIIAFIGGIVIFSPKILASIETL